MPEVRFVHVTYIRTTPEKLWNALLKPEFTQQYWFAAWHESNWSPGADWKLCIPDGRVGHQGKVLEIEPLRKLVLSWRGEIKPDWQAEDYSRVTFELEPMGESVKLTVIHETDAPESPLIDTLSHGWPHLLASLKSLLETGESLVETRQWPKGL